MHEEEIFYFTEALKLVQEKCYIDAVKKFQTLVDTFPESDLADDALYNIGLCYYGMCQFEKSIKILEEMIAKYPDSTITALEHESEFGKTAAKGYYLIVQCCIGLDDVDKAQSYIKNIEKYNTTYILKDSKKITFFELSKNAIETYRNISK